MNDPHCLCKINEARLKVKCEEFQKQVTEEKENDSMIKVQYNTLVNMHDRINAFQQTSFEEMSVAIVQSEINNQPKINTKTETASEVGNATLVSNVNISVADNQELGLSGRLTIYKLYKYIISCKKNPDHKGFIPLKDFNTSCLPSRYHNNELMFKTIKTLAALTVQVKTKFTSLERPEFYPGTQVPYPCYNDRESHVIRLGTGIVCQVYKYTASDSTCRCAKCQDSSNPSKVWGAVCVLTAMHLVFDASEARQTSCVLGFDDITSPVVSLDGWEACQAHLEGDWCYLRYVTCDLKLIDKLSKMYSRFLHLCHEVKQRYRLYSDVDKLVVLVSHPHGCAKHVYVGQWTQKHKRDSMYTRYWYTTATCPGSAGAYVYRVGCNPEYSRHVHNGAYSQRNSNSQSIDFDFQTIVPCC